MVTMFTRMCCFAVMWVASVASVARGFVCARASAAVLAAPGTPPLAGQTAVVPDLPLPLAEYIDACSLSVWTPLNKDKMFPDKSSFNTIVRK
jgi:hypothetical protein